MCSTTFVFIFFITLKYGHEKEKETLVVFTPDVPVFFFWSTVIILEKFCMFSYLLYLLFAIKFLTTNFKGKLFSI